MTTEVLAGLGALVLSLVFSYVPGVHEWYSAQKSEVQSGIMAVCVLVVAVGAFLASCAGLEASFSCTREGLWALAKLIFLTLVVNQSTYILSPQKPAKNITVINAPNSAGVAIGGSVQRSNVVTAGRDAENHS